MLDRLLGQEYILDPKVRAAAFAAYEEAGLKVMEPLADELTLDYDDVTELPPAFHAARETLALNGHGIDWTTTTSKSGTGLHVYVRLDFSPDPAQRIAMQAAFGSDPVRELLSVLRLWRGHERPIVLFETAEEAARVEAFRVAPRPEVF